MIRARPGSAEKPIQPPRAEALPRHGDAEQGRQAGDRLPHTGARIDRDDGGHIQARQRGGEMHEEHSRFAPMNGHG